MGAPGGLYRNVYLRHVRGSAEVDAVVASPKGLLVVEAKGFSGEIRGSLTRHEWRRTWCKRGSSAAQSTAFLLTPCGKTGATWKNWRGAWTCPGPCAAA